MGRGRKARLIHGYPARDGEVAGRRGRERGGSAAEGGSGVESK